MADLNALIAQGIRPVQIEDPLTQATKAAAFQGLQQERQLNALKLQQSERDIQEQNALRDLLRRGVDFSTPEGQRQLLGTSPTAGRDILKSLAETGRIETETLSRQADLAEKRVNLYRDQLPNVTSPAQARQWTYAVYSDPVLAPVFSRFGGSPEQAASAIPDDPAAFAEWRSRTAMRASDLVELIKNQATANVPKVVAPGGSVFDPRTGAFTTAPEATPGTIREMQALGYPTTAEGFAAYQSAKGRAAPGTTVNVGLPQQERAFETGLGQGQAERILKSQAAATDAASIIDTVNTGRQIMKSGMITGAGAEFFVNLNQALKTAGIDAGYSDASANSQAFAANMASNVGRVIKQFGAGTGLSNADREYAEKMAGGKITLDAAAINRILDINERAARNVIKAHNKNVKDIKTNIPLTVEEPPEIRAGLSAQDKEALDWANANPKDRRAAEIKKRLGM